MKLKLFTDSVTCTSQAHCNLCRNKEEGRTWRQSLTAAYSLPEDQVDFECPYGKAWEGSFEAIKGKHNCNCGGRTAAQRIKDRLAKL